MHSQSLKTWVASQSRLIKQAIMIIVDSLLVLFALWLSFSLRWGELYVPQSGVLVLILASPLYSIPVFSYFGLYHAIVRYINFETLWNVVKAVTLSSLIFTLIVNLTAVKIVPRSVTLINWMVTILFVGGVRVFAHWWFRELISNVSKASKPDFNRVIIYGAGEAGIQLAISLLNNKKYQPVAFVDDDRSLHRKVIHGISIYKPEQLSNLKSRLNVNQVLLAMPSISNSRRKAIIESIEPLSLRVKTVPPVNDIVSGDYKLEEVREIEIDDLLGRDPVQPDNKLISHCITGKNVMVSGAGGSIGSELCRQIMLHDPSRLVLFEISEYNLFNIERELHDKYPDALTRIIPVLGSVQDRSRVDQIIRLHQIQVIYHAAAYKHVPMVEQNPVEGVSNNIFGTQAIGRSALDNNVEYFVLVSTDKAVRPTNVMGATKRVSEMIVQSLANRSEHTHFCMVRFGNVLDSSGSVVPLFREQIKSGGPVRVTHRDILRYFMTIPEAAELVIQAGALSENGEVFILDMGEPVRIYELARKMIHLAGYQVRDSSNPDGDIEITFTGLRPGEKLFEELLIDNNVSGTRHPRIVQALEAELDIETLSNTLQSIEQAVVKHDVEALYTLLESIVTGYHHTGITADQSDPGYKESTSISTVNENQKTLH